MEFVMKKFNRESKTHVSECGKPVNFGKELGWPRTGNVSRSSGEITPGFLRNRQWSV